MKSSLPVVFCILFLVGSRLAAFGQGAPGGPGASLSGAMLKLFGEANKFTAKADMNAVDRATGDTTSLVMEYALSGDKTRMEMDLAQMKSALMPATMVAQMKQMGMDKNIIIVRPDKKIMWAAYPGLKAYLELPMPDDEVAAAEAEYKIEKIELGKEVVEKHPCTKNKVILTNPRGVKYEALCWNASDLKDFPVQLAFEDKGSTVTLRYRDIKLAPPVDKQFEPPAGYTKFDDQQRLMQLAMQKMMGSSKKK